jgi:hypothetical protein
MQDPKETRSHERGPLAAVEGLSDPARVLDVLEHELVHYLGDDLDAYLGDDPNTREEQHARPE